MNAKIKFSPMIQEGHVSDGATALVWVDGRVVGEIQKEMTRSTVISPWEVLGYRVEVYHPETKETVLDTFFFVKEYGTARAALAAAKKAVIQSFSIL
jgi:hypothetical protein